MQGLVSDEAFSEAKDRIARAEGISGDDLGVSVSFRSSLVGDSLLLQQGSRFFLFEFWFLSFRIFVGRRFGCPSSALHWIPDAFESVGS